MTRPSFKVAAAFLALAFLAVSAAAQAAPQAAKPDKPVDMKKLIAEIVGDYNFDVQGQSMLIQFTESGGKVFGAPVGETPEEIHPVEGKPLCFDVTVSGSGQYYFLEFVRNEKGVIDTCLLTAEGMTVTGTKVIK
ncbi:MAG TPA: hypothetical protein VLJ16_09685 [Acidobacteriota bacterium]|nr:hypothetical protein [Acidobacteriota bacterium]